MALQVTLPSSAVTPRSRTLFQEEERQRYNQPSKAFRYTAVDGGRSTVAPAVRAGAKVQGKAREHAMLKLDRPPSVTVLSLVRDAASRLPNGMGTRADVCTLLRDSQFVIHDTPDNQVQGARAPPFLTFTAHASASALHDTEMCCVVSCSD